MKLTKMKASTRTQQEFLNRRMLLLSMSMQGMVCCCS
jgi:hypothetical protein